MSGFSLSVWTICLQWAFRYDFFKAELLKTSYFDDNIICHFTASFGAVRLSRPEIEDKF